MKKLGLLIFAFLLISNLSAIEFNLNSEYPRGGAILATLSGSFQETLTKDNFKFYRGNVRIPLTFEISKIQDIYYLYANLADKEPNNYSIILEDVTYFKGAKVVKEDIQRNFTITNKTADFSIDKGFVVTEDDFSLTIQNLQDFKINISYKFAEEKQADIYSGEFKILNFEINNITPREIKKLEISSGATKYEIPVYVLGVPEIKSPVNFSFDVSKVNVILDLNNQTKRIVYLINSGDEPIFQIKLSLDEELEKYVILSQTEFLNVSSEFLYPLEISIFSDDLPKKILGNLTARSGTIERSVILNISFFPGYVGVEDLIKSCSELNGELCDSSSCNGQISQASDGNCCFGVCSSSTESSPVSWRFLGWSILVILIIVLVWFYFKKYRNAEAPAKGVFKFLKKE